MHLYFVWDMSLQVKEVAERKEKEMNAFRFKHNFIVKVIKWEVIYSL